MRLSKHKYFFLGMGLLLLLVLLAAIASGAVAIGVDDMGGAINNWLQGQKPSNIYQGVFLQIRLPRVLLCAVTGAILSVSGVLMQGLFRNPIVEPGLVGTSAGAALGASFVFVFAGVLGSQIQAIFGPFLVPFFAFLGGLLASLLVFSLASSHQKISVTSLLLVGVAVNAVALSGTGFLSYLARDPQARSISFWNLGTFSGATWMQVWLVSAMGLLGILFSLVKAKHLNALLLGEDEADYLGVDTKKMQKQILLINTAMVAVATAFVGVIAFMGLIVPHIMRILFGSNHRVLIPATILAGAILLSLADLGARLILAPAEIPIGIITSLVGAPIYIFLLRSQGLLEKGGGYD